MKTAIISKPKWFIVWDSEGPDGEDENGYYRTFTRHWKGFDFQKDGEKRVYALMERMVDEGAFDPANDRKMHIIYGLTINGQLFELKQA